MTGILTFAIGVILVHDVARVVLIYEHPEVYDITDEHKVPGN